MTPFSRPQGGDKRLLCPATDVQAADAVPAGPGCALSFDISWVRVI